MLINKNNNKRYKDNIKKDNDKKIINKKLNYLQMKQAKDIHEFI